MGDRGKGRATEAGAETERDKHAKTEREKDKVTEKARDGRRQGQEETEGDRGDRGQRQRDRETGNRDREGQVWQGWQGATRQRGQGGSEDRRIVPPADAVRGRGACGALTMRQ